ncbi:thioredoxin family protein [Verrucomicrobiaceae bacterium R5-34]|uniref:Thioredoxin family protein n=1 Tax=Oceaniferula flava TaxID=2800421 RepID=A0AAE2S9H1_9BACT|nr:thioredoxin family protein [Oceaniferula flavus]MBK1829571.1 thioredoxin family protein [Verrucomicrobiaceae bacterium R5-34]MBK1853790.1 thioredoxin family protein [Oceaniferula flavus]MBM1135096.1 thioredoxin family protein [Oceaniferula flavus]
MKKTILASLALAITASFATAGGENWMNDFKAAQKKAAAENKDLLVDFTGSDWCGWCIKLNKEVFQHDPFKTGVADKFVLVELDFPRDKSKLSKETQEQNAALQAKYEVRGFPTILLLDSEGRPYAKTGYQAGGPEKYVAHLDELRAKRTERDEALKAAESLEGVAKAKQLVKALETIPEDYHSQYSELTEQVAKLDPNDETGYVAKQQHKAALENLAKEVMMATRSGKVDEALSSVDKFLADNSLEGEEKQQIIAMKMNPLLANKKFDEAGVVLDEIIAAAPESNYAKQATAFKARLAKMKESAQ